MRTRLLVAKSTDGVAAIVRESGLETIGIMPVATVNGFEMYYQAAGRGEPVVYIHGGFPNLESVLLDLPRDGTDWGWEHDFAGHFQFVSYDRRGCFRSACPEDGYGLLDLARDLEGLLDELSIPSVHLIGSSAGGPIATAFAATRAHRTRSLSLTGTASNLFPPDDITKVVVEQIGYLRELGPEAAFDRRPAGVEVSLGVLWEPPEHEERGTLAEYWERQRLLNRRVEEVPRALRVRHYAAELMAIEGYIDADVAGYARRVRAPTLVLHGSNDREVPVEWGRELARTIPGARLEVFDGASHSLVIRDRKARERVIDFIREPGETPPM